MTDLATLKKLNAARWAAAKLTRAGEFTPVAKRLHANKARYQEVETSTGVPWFIVAVIHEREASGDFSKSIAQGDPWDRVSIHVPAGRGPFRSFLDAAKDALINCAPHAAAWKDWGVGGALTLLEEYNGLGYANKGLPSPYIWSGTDQYTHGKYVADGVFSPTAVDKQLGCAGLLMALRALDSSVRFADEVQVKTPSPAPPPETPKPAPPAPPQTGSWASALLTLTLAVVNAVFNRSKNP